MTTPLVSAPAVDAGHADHGHGHDAHGHDHHHGYAHVMPIWVLVAVFLALIALTILTVFASNYPLGAFEMVVSMGIATVKALLVAVWFMHLRHDKSFTIIMLVFSLFFVAIFIGATLVDSLNYQPEIIERSFDTYAPPDPNATNTSATTGGNMQDTPQAAPAH